MKRCKRCDILIMDDTALCPLCDSVLDGDEPGVNTYPKLEDEFHRTVLFRKIIYFILLTQLSQHKSLNIAWINLA